MENFPGHRRLRGCFCSRLTPVPRASFQANRVLVQTMKPSPSRSALMRRVRRRDTGPEMAVRRLLHQAGYRFRLQAADLPGRPDIVFRSRRKVIFVHGCFWHRHQGCRRATIPRTRQEFWEHKFAANRQRDNEAVSSLERDGWQVAIVWECQFEDIRALKGRLVSFLEGSV